MTGELATKSECMEEWGGRILGARRRRYALQEHCGAGPWETRRPTEVCSWKGGREVHWVWKKRIARGGNISAQGGRWVSS